MIELTTPRLVIRPFSTDDLEAAWRLFDRDGTAIRTSHAETPDARRRWLEWSVLSYEQLEALHQPPYGDRAVVLAETGELIGAVGFAPCLGPFGQVWGKETASPGLSLPEFGLFWQIASDHRLQGYATEAGGAMLRYALDVLRLERMIATTDFENAASIRVMEKLGMTIHRNPLPEPFWLQIVGFAQSAVPIPSTPGPSSRRASRW